MRVIKKNYQLYAFHFHKIVNMDHKEQFLLHPILKEFEDVFLDELSGMPPIREFDFSIELILGVKPITHISY